MKPVRIAFFASLITTPAWVQLVACEKYDTCENTLSCPEYAEGDGDASTGGNGDGDGDGDEATGGNGGDGGAPVDRCADCSGSTPICNDDDECVECTRDQHCEASGQVCDAEVCVECAENSDCSDPDASVCDANGCTACDNDNDCAHIGGKGVCDGGTCVECTATKYEACGVDTEDTGNPFVCDVLNKTCSTTETEGGADLCEPCISDTHCPAGQACVLQRYESEDVGYFCFTQPGVAGNPFSCDRPYSDLQNTVETIEEAETDICGLEVTTCPAIVDFREKDCAVGSPPTPDDSLCGHDGGTDGYCRIFQDFPGEDNDLYRCTVPCGSDVDCKSGFDCQTDSPDVCEL